MSTKLWPSRSALTAIVIFLAIAVLHLLNGATEVSWSPHVPEVQRALGIGDALLGYALLGLPIGLIVGGFVAGRMTDRLGTTKTLVAGAAGFWGGLVLVGLVPSVAPSPWTLAGALFIVGAGNGLYDVAWGVQSTTFEKGKRYRLHVGVQSAFSLGSIAGAWSGQQAIGSHISVGTHLTVFAIIALGTAVPLMLAVLPDIRGDATPDHGDGEERDASTPSSVHEPGRSPLRSPILWGLAVMALAFGLTLGAVYVWSTPHLERLGAVGGAAATGLVWFTITQTIGQLGIAAIPKDKVASWVYATVGGLIALVGSWLVVGPGEIREAVIGFALIGLGLAPIGGLAQSVAEEHFTYRPGLVMSVLMISTYAGVLGAPGLIGPLAEWQSLRWAMGGLGVCAGAVLILGLLVMPRATPAHRK